MRSLALICTRGCKIRACQSIADTRSSSRYAYELKGRAGGERRLADDVDKDGRQVQGATVAAPALLRAERQHEPDRRCQLELQVDGVLLWRSDALTSRQCTRSTRSASERA